MPSLYSTSSSAGTSSARPCADSFLSSNSIKNKTDVLLNKFLQNNDLNLLENYLNLSKCSPSSIHSQVSAANLPPLHPLASPKLYAPLLTNTSSTAVSDPSALPLLLPKELAADLLDDNKNSISATIGSRTTIVAASSNSSSSSKTTSCTASVSGGSRVTSPYSTPGSIQTSAGSPLNQFKHSPSSLEKTDDDFSSQMLQRLISSESNKSMEYLINEYQTSLNNSRNSILSLQKREKELLIFLKKSSSDNLPNKKIMTSQFKKKSDTSKAACLTEDLSIETFVKCNDLLLYYKVFTAICLKESNSSSSRKLISYSNERVVNLFNDIVDFSNKINPILNLDSDDVNNIDDFNYDSLKNNQTHLGFKAKIHNFESGSEDIDIPNSLALIIIKQYDTLNFKTLNYILYLCHNFKPNNCNTNITESKASNTDNDQNQNENETSLKKLKSCSRCRKNKIKCDSVLKFSYSCSNCFKKNVNFIKSSIKRNYALSNDNTHTSGNNLFTFFQTSNNKYAVLPDNQYSASKLEKPVAMKRSESVPLISNFEIQAQSYKQQRNGRGCGSLACEALHSCLNEGCNNPSGLHEESQEQAEYHVSNVKLFLRLFNLQIVYEEDQHKYRIESLDNGQSLSNLRPPMDHHNNSMLINCKLQLISSNLLLKKKSMKKNNLINSLVSDIDYLKNEINLMIERESKLVNLLYLKSVDATNFSNTNSSHQCGPLVDYSNVKRLLDQVEFPNSKKRKF